MKPSAPCAAVAALLAVFLATLPGFVAAAPAVVEGARMDSPRAGHQATLLADGQVLVTGGCATAGCAEVLRSSEVYDPVGQRFAPGAAMHQPRVSHTATPLPDGRVFITGGWTGSAASDATEWFDAAAGRFVAGPAMAVARMDGTATLLDDGRVLVAGGAVRTNEPTAVVELFDPVRAQFAATGALLQPRAHHAAVRLRDGRVLVVGGLVGRRTATASAEIYDPRSGRFRATAALAGPRCKAAALLLADGRVMVLAGSRDCDDRQRLATTEIFDPATGRFEPGPRLADARYKIASAAVRLDGGEVLIAGGASDVEIWRPGTPAFVRATPALGIGLAFSTATVLGGERVLVIGGYDEAIVPTARSWQVSALAGLRR